MGSGRRLLPVAAAVTLALVLAGCTASSTSGSAGVVTVTSETTAGAGSSDAGGSSGQVTVSGGDDASANGSAAASSPTTSTSTKPVVLPPVAKVSASPAFGSKNLSPSAPIAIKVDKGVITTLTFTNPQGKKVKGTMSADHTTWTLGEVLGFGKTYTVHGSSRGIDNKRVDFKGTYTMLGEENEADVYITPGDGEVVGIGQSVILKFPSEPVDKAAIEKALTITTSPKVEGAWGWIHHDDGWGIDWRPKDYWPANTKVHVEAKIYGLKIAPGQYASSDLTSDFTIGRAQVVYADASSFQIVVKTGCKGKDDPDACAQTVATYPASYGSGDDVGDANRVTRSGIHVVNEMLPVHQMSNPAYGYSNVTEYWDVRISNNGEFIHQNQGTVGDQGSVNVSHGCINLSAENAEAFFHSSLIGDPVEVTGTSVDLSSADGDMFDWTLSWSQWKALSAL